MRQDPVRILDVDMTPSSSSSLTPPHIVTHLLPSNSLLVFFLLRCFSWTRSSTRTALCARSQTVALLRKRSAHNCPHTVNEISPSSRQQQTAFSLLASLLCSLHLFFAPRTSSLHTSGHRRVQRSFISRPRHPSSFNTTAREFSKGLSCSWPFQPWPSESIKMMRMKKHLITTTKM